jgi:hypothetical protein
MRRFIQQSGTEEVVPELVKTKFLYLTSRQRTNDIINGFEVNLPSGFFNKRPNQQIKISLANITVQKTWYETRAGISADYENFSGSFSIPDGSYTVDYLIDMLNADTHFSNDYTVSYSYTTNKFTFTPVNGFSFIRTTNCGYLLGLVDGITYSGSFDSVNPVMMTYEKTIYVNSNLGSSGSSLDNISQQQLDFSTILATIPIPVYSFDVIQYTTNQFPNSGLLIDGNYIDSIRIWISTDHDNIPEFFEDFEVCLKVEFFHTTPLSS